MVAGLMSGTCMLPSKFVRGWKWKNVWLVFSVSHLWMISLDTRLYFCGPPVRNVSSSDPSAACRSDIAGRRLGVAQILFGVSVKRLGLVSRTRSSSASAQSSNTGSTLCSTKALAKEHALILILSGVVIMSVGIFLTAWSGQIKERAVAIHESASHRSYFAAIFLAVLCGSWHPC